VELYWEAHTFMIGKLYSIGRKTNIASRKMGNSTLFVLIASKLIDLLQLHDS
jgi:hypothetical protein